MPIWPVFILIIHDILRENNQYRAESNNPFQKFIKLLGNIYFYAPNILTVLSSVLD